MAIDNTGISSLETGAPDIKYTGDEGPNSPEENREIASAILGDESGDIASELWSRMSPSERSEWGSIENFIQSDDFKIILINLQTRRGSRGGIQMASAADDMLPTANMNIGGRVGLANGQLVKPSRHGSRPGYRGPGTYQGRGMTGSGSRNTKGGPAGGATIGSGSIQSGSPRDYSPPAQQIIGGKTYDVTPETRDQRDLLFETQKEKKEKKNR